MTFWITKSGEVFADESGMDLWNTYKQEDLPPPDSVDLELDPLTGEVSVIEYGYEDPSDVLQDEMDPASGQSPPTTGAPDPDQVQMPPYLSPDVGGSGGNYEEFSGYLDRMSKVYTPARETEIEKGKFLKQKELYKALSKGWSTDNDINRIIENTRLMMKAFPDDGKFLEKAGEVLCSFDYTLPNTRIVKCIRKNFSTKEYEDMAKAGIITPEEARNAIEFSKIREEAKMAEKASTPDTMDFTISPRTGARFTELKEDAMNRCEVCKQDEDGRFLRCERCSMRQKTRSEQQ